MPSPCILVVDDERHLVWAVQRSLSELGYQVLTAYDGLEALTVAHRYEPDIVVLDIVMPGLDGFEVSRRLRRDPVLADVPILFLTARSAIEDRIAGFDQGGDDYLVKPFDLRELKARIDALLRRSQLGARQEPPVESSSSTLKVGPLSLDLNAYQVRVGGTGTVQLTPTEFDLLQHLMRHPGQVFSAQQLLQRVWGYPLETTDPSLVRWHVRNLRAKIEPDPAHPVHICTLPRLGYVYATAGTA